MKEVISTSIFIAVILTIFIAFILSYRRRIKEESITDKDAKEEEYLEKEVKKAEKKEKIVKPKT